MSTHAAHYLQLLPLPLQERTLLHWQNFHTALTDAQLSLPVDKEFWRSIFRVFAISEYVADACCRTPQLLVELFNSGDVLRDYLNQEYITRLQTALQGVHDEQHLKNILRKFREREMVRIIWRDLAGWADLKVTMKALSALADACIDLSAKILFEWQCERDGIPQDYLGRTQDLMVIALGKLGGRELNLSSDVDLMFAFAAPGHTSGEDGVEHEVFFSRIGKKLIQALSETTADGFVFRVDMRLRPLGQSGPIVMHFGQLDDYYREQGRDWERYALVKARVISGNPIAAGRLLAILRPFVYRPYLDFTAIEALRAMHAMIAGEVKQKKLHGHVKLGPGGIRQIEFIVQAHQLIRGGENPWLQDRRIFKALLFLSEAEVIDKAQAEILRQAYIFLRDVEHRLQAVHDRQTHELPTDERAQLVLAYAMRYADWASFEKVLSEHRNQVEQQFEQLLAKPQLEDAENQNKFHDEIELIWFGEQVESDATTLLTNMGFENTEHALQILTALRSSERVRNMSPTARAQLDQLMPLLLWEVGKVEQSALTLHRIIPLLEALASRSVYLTLLLENPKVLTQLVRLCSVGPSIAEQLAAHPLLLGELIHPKRLYAPLDFTTLGQQLSRLLSSIPEDALEEQMEALRRFRLMHTFRVTVMDVTSVLPLMRVSDHLTNIATVILQHVQWLSWQHLVAKHGMPRGSEKTPKFGIIAYGKLGGIELGYGSDLDLVFVYDRVQGLPAEQKMTTGKQSVTHRVFYTRLAQRILHLLSAQTYSGSLYPVDTRLRPSGKSGLLVISLDRFASYQQNEAWTWEHQALVRARLVTGGQALAQKFSAIREKVLTRKRDASLLRDEVVEMRDRMRKSTKPASEGQFDIKQCEGGMTDIEFLAQFMVLCYAHAYPTLLAHPDNIRILESLGQEGLLSAAEVRLLSDAYRTYRAAVHRLDLQKLPSYLPEQHFKNYREQVLLIWQRVMLNHE